MCQGLLKIEILPNHQCKWKEFHYVKAMIDYNVGLFVEIDVISRCTTVAHCRLGQLSDMSYKIDDIFYGLESNFRNCSDEKYVMLQIHQNWASSQSDQLEWPHGNRGSHAYHNASMGLDALLIFRPTIIYINPHTLGRKD
jgi:hypothetical protein